MYLWMSSEYMSNNNQMLNLTNQLNYYQQKLNEQIQNSTNSIYCSSQNVVNQ